MAWKEPEDMKQAPENAQWRLSPVDEMRFLFLKNLNIDNTRNQGPVIIATSFRRHQLSLTPSCLQNQLAELCLGFV